MSEDSFDVNPDHDYGPSRTVLQLRAEIERLRFLIAADAERLALTAAFLDGLAKWLEVGGVWNTGRDPAADCRAMAAKLRGET